MVDIATLPVEVAEYIIGLRKESARLRVERNVLRAELEALKAGK